MGWTGRTFKSEDIPRGAMLEALNELSAEQGLTAKVATSNAEGSDAAGIILWFRDGADVVHPTGGAWREVHLASGGDNLDFLRDEAVRRLNDTPLERALNIRMTMANMSGGDATLTLFYPS